MSDNAILVTFLILGLLIGISIGVLYSYDSPYSCQNINPDIKLCNVNDTAYLITSTGDVSRVDKEVEKR